MGGLDSNTSPEILSIELPSVGEHHCPGRHVETNGKSLGREKDLDEALLMRETMTGRNVAACNNKKTTACRNASGFGCCLAVAVFYRVRRTVTHHQATWHDIHATLHINEAEHQGITIAGRLHTSMGSQKKAFVP